MDQANLNRRGEFHACSKKKRISAANEFVEVLRLEGALGMLHTSTEPRRRLSESTEPAGRPETACIARDALPGGSSRNSCDALSHVVRAWRVLSEVPDEEPGSFMRDAAEAPCRGGGRRCRGSTLHAQRSAACGCCEPRRTVDPAGSEIFEPLAGTSLPRGHERMAGEQPWRARAVEGYHLRRKLDPALCSASSLHKRYLHAGSQPHDVPSSNPRTVRNLPYDLQGEVCCRHHGTVRLKTRAAGLPPVVANQARQDTSQNAASFRTRPFLFTATCAVVSPNSPPPRKSPWRSQQRALLA
jgi:hypothetical protein